jgi:hypothetical protein
MTTPAHTTLFYSQVAKNHFGTFKTSFLKCLIFADFSVSNPVVIAE